ncbi:MAG: DUF4815 domain-containing protein [Wolbachia endosymbiont of Penenirmus auritus]|nr:DUF4815 domain-containing protein [Wolbachia endosymbiont of Penenirmus auritus]
MTLNGYYNRFDPDKEYEKSLFLAGRGLQSAELNETQEYALSKLKGIGDAIFRDGDVIAGSNCIIDAETGEVTLESGKIYLRGAVRKVEGKRFTIPLNTTVRIGVYYVESTITELEDENLRDPAVGTRNYQEVGAARLKVSTVWGYQAEGVFPRFSTTDGEFYPIYNIENGVLIEHSPPPQANIVTTALARYDKEANGSYVVSGLEVMFLQTEEEKGEGGERGAKKQVFVVNGGKARVDGYEIELSHSIRAYFDEDPDIKTVASESHTFQPNSQKVMELKVHDFPVREIKRVDITVQKTITMTHGSYSGAIDPIPDSAILEIIQIKQGDVIYENGTDYKLSSGNVDWSLPGREPAPGSSYQITYRSRTHISPENVSEEGCKIKGAVDGSLVLVDYTWKMPRYDLITIDAKGVVRRIKGIAHPWKPSMPKAPSGQLLLCYIRQTWKNGEKVKVVNNAIHAVPMNELEAMKRGINDLYALVAEERLRNDANSREPTTKKGVFVDPFFDDDMRDQGIVQSAAIVNKELILPIDVEIIDAEKGKKPYLLPYELEPVLEQLLQTKSEKINPYQAFDPVPAKVTLNMNIDHWTEVSTIWKSPVTREFNTRETELLSSRSYEAEFMREAVQNFEIEGFAAHEKLKEIKFDGITIQPVA